MSQQDFEEGWEQKKRYLIRTMFSTLPVLSPISECPEPQGESARSPSEARESPLPELLVEPEKKTKHDESESFYNRLEVRMKKYYRHLIYGESMSDLSDIDVEFEGDYTAIDNVTTSNLSETAEDSYLHERLAESDGKHKNDESGGTTGSGEDTSMILLDEESSKSSTKWETVQTQAVIENERASFKDIENEAVEEIHKETPASESTEPEDLSQDNINSNKVTPPYNPFDFEDESETNEDLAETTGNNRDTAQTYEIIRERTRSEEESIIEISEDRSTSDKTFKVTVIEKEKAIFEEIEKEAKQIAEEETSDKEVEVMRKQSHDIRNSHIQIQQEKEFSADTLPDLSPSKFSMEFGNDSGDMTFTPKGAKDPTRVLSNLTPKLSPIISLGTKRTGSFNYEVPSKQKRREEIFEPKTKDTESQTDPKNANDVATQATIMTRNVCTETYINSLVYEIIDESGDSSEYENIHTQTETTQNMERGTQTEYHFEHRWFLGVIGAFPFY